MVTKLMSRNALRKEQVLPVYCYYSSGFSTLLFIVVTYGGFLIVLLFYPIIAAIMRKKALAMVHGSIISKYGHNPKGNKKIKKPENISGSL